jgi:ketosteroid isomerase-like protein
MTKNVREIFASIDSFDPADFVTHLTDDVVFRFGNGDPLHGPAAVQEAVAGFFSSISGLTHHILHIWEPEEGLVILHVDVEYRRQDGETVYTPNVDILRFEGDKVADWQIVIDLAPVYAPIAEVPAAVLTPATATQAA